MSYKYNKYNIDKFTKEQKILIVKLYMELVYELKAKSSGYLNTKAVLNIAIEYVINGSINDYIVIYDRLMETYGSEDNLDAIAKSIINKTVETEKMSTIIEIDVIEDEMIESDDLSIKINI